MSTLKQVQGIMNHTSTKVMSFRSCFGIGFSPHAGSTFAISEPDWIQNRLNLGIVEIKESNSGFLLPDFETPHI